MEESFNSFAIGLRLSFILLFLILVAQFRSFIDPFLIMLAIPMGFIGVLIILPLTHTTLNVMSLMGVLMLVGIADSNSILIVDFAHRLEEQGLSVAGCRDHGLPRPPAADSDDLARHHHRHDAHGPEAGHRQRAICAHGARHHRRPDLLGAADGLHRSGGLSAGLRAKEGISRRPGRGAREMRAFHDHPVGRIAATILLLTALGCAQTPATQQSPQPLPPAPTPQALAAAPAAASVSGNMPTAPVTTLSLKDAESLALKNNPQISAARLTALASRQVTREQRSNLWPTVTGKHYRCGCAGKQSNHSWRSEQPTYL